MAPKKTVGVPGTKKKTKQKPKSDPKPQSTGTAGGSYGYGGYGGGGGGGSSSPQKSETYTTEVNKTSDKTTTRNIGDVTTVNTTGTDENAQKNLLANVQGTIQSLIDAQDQAEDLYRQNLDSNEAVARQQTLENDRNANNNWYRNQQKLQNASGALRSSLGNGQYGMAGRSLDYLTRVYDDMADQELLNTQRQNQNEIYQDLYSANANAANDYNESLISNQQEVMDMVMNYLGDYNDYLGNKTTQRNRTDETLKSTTDGTTKSWTQNKSKTDDVTPGAKDTVLSKLGETVAKAKKGAASQGMSGAGSSGGKSDDTTYTTNTNKTRTKSSNDIVNRNTGNNAVDTTVSTFLSPYLNPDGSLNYDKVGQALGIRFTNRTFRLGDKVTPPKLQQQNNYRSPRDTVAALSRRYG